MGGLVLDDGACYGFQKEVYSQDIPIQVFPHIGVWEAAAVYVLAILFKNRLENRHVILHVDNAGVVWSLVKGNTKCEMTRRVLRNFFEIQCFDFWAEWISTERNGADHCTRTQRMGALCQELRPTFVANPRWLQPKIIDAVLKDIV